LSASPEFLGANFYVFEILEIQILQTTAHHNYHKTMHAPRMYPTMAATNRDATGTI